jgi:hypothetical protein
MAHDTTKTTLDTDTLSASLEQPALSQFFVYDPKKKPYKPVAKKVRPVLQQLPGKFRIERNITGDPLATMPPLNPNPPPFQPTGRYTQERKDDLEKVHGTDFLWPQEIALMHDFMCNQNEAFAWTDQERGSFRSDFFPPVDFPVVPHTPWVEKNIPIPPGVFDEVCDIIKKKLDAGTYERSNSSYRSRWFCVYKKDGKSLRPVHALESLNRVSIQHSGVPPVPEHIVEQFAGRACGAMLDLYVGYDERLIAESSRDFTTFQTPFGALRLVTLPMGYTNSVPIFHDDVTYILRSEIPKVTVPYIDDVPGKGPESRYMDENGNYEVIALNPGIRRFVWEHFENMNRVVQHMRYSGGTFSGKKLLLCVPEFIFLGHRCTIHGRLPDQSRIDSIKKWTILHNLSEVRAFLGTIGVARIFIKNFAKRAHPLNKLTRTGVPFEFGPEQIQAMDDLRDALVHSPALKPINYHSPSPVILAVDTSNIAIGYLLCQCDIENPKRRIYNRFGSITLNDRESRFSQPKLEIYGVFRSLRTLRLYLLGVRNLTVEVDARYIAGMLRNPDIAPNATINRWIVSILMFQFTLVHVPGTLHGPDGLSRRNAQPDDIPADPTDGNFDDWVDNMYGFMHFINPTTPSSTSRRVSTFIMGTRANPRARDNDDEDSEDDHDSDRDVDEDEDTDIEPRDVQRKPIRPDAVIYPITYDDIPRKTRATLDDERLDLVRTFLKDLVPPKLDEKTLKRFIKYCLGFFLDGLRLWKKDPNGAHKLVIPPRDRLELIIIAHDGIGHKGNYATRAHITDRFWWPGVQADIHWFVKTCHICQERQRRQILIPPVVPTPAPIFSKVHADTMHLPTSGGYHYIVQGRCSLTTWPEFRKLRKENGQTIGDWIFEDLLCRWGSLREIVTDNGPPFIKALDYLAKRYKINHIRVSGYNHRANGLVEQTHFDVRQSLYKAADGDEHAWSKVVYPVFWAERVTVRKRMGCSPYFATTGSHPLLPLDFVQATYLLPPPDSVLSTEDLISRRAIALQKRSEHLAQLYNNVYSARIATAKKFEEAHANNIHDYDFKNGDLVLMRNSQTEASLNSKMLARYNGPYIVISRGRGGSYIVCELNGAVYHRPVGAFRVLPYLARKSIPLPANFLDITTERLREMENSDDIDD